MWVLLIPAPGPPSRTIMPWCCAVFGLKRLCSAWEEPPPVHICRLHFRLKAGVVKGQVREWRREDGSLKKLAAQVEAALDALAE